MVDVTAAIYRDGHVIERVALDASFPQHRESEFIWVDVIDPVDSAFAILQERFGLHSRAIEDSMRAVQVPKVHLYDDQIFVVLKAAHLQNDEIKYGGIDAFVSRHHIITVRHAAGGRAQTHEEFQSAPKPVQVRPDFILHAILDVVVNDYFPVVQMVEDEVLLMEQRLQDAFLGRDEITRLFRLRREAIHLQHVMTRMSDVCGKLANLDVPCIGAATKPYFSDVRDHLMRMDGMVSGLVDVIRTVFETSSLLEQQRQSITTRQLAAWAAILGVPAAIASIYGMAVPELHVPYGYAIVFGAMTAICLGLYFRFRRLRWL